MYIINLVSAPVAAGGGGASWTETFESATWQADSSWTAFDPRDTGTDRSANFVRQSTWKYAGTYGMEMLAVGAETGTIVLRRDYGKFPASMRIYFNRDSSKSNDIVFGYGPTVSGDSDYEGGCMAIWRMSTSRLGVGNLDSTGNIAYTQWYNTVSGLTNGVTYYIELSFSTVGATTTVTVNIVRASDDNVMGTNSLAMNNSTWSNEIFVGVSSVTGISTYYFDNLEVYDS